MKCLKTLWTFWLHLQPMCDFEKKKEKRHTTIHINLLFFFFFLAAAIIAFSNYGHLLMHEVSRPCYLLPPQ